MLTYHSTATTIKQFTRATGAVYIVHVLDAMLVNGQNIVTYELDSYSIISSISSDIMHLCSCKLLVTASNLVSGTIF